MSVTNVEVCGLGGREVWKDEARGSERGRSMRSDCSGVTHRLLSKKKKKETESCGVTRNVIQIPHLIYIKKQGQACKCTILQAMAPYGSVRIKPSVCT